eukprot:scaffold4707_cov164-Amphora_coffeaeformis.AAC.10
MKLVDCGCFTKRGHGQRPVYRVEKHPRSKTQQQQDLHWYTGLWDYFSLLLRHQVKPAQRKLVYNANKHVDCTNLPRGKNEATFRLIIFASRVTVTGLLNRVTMIMVVGGGPDRGGRVAPS